jgi:hypothetical protein
MNTSFPVNPYFTMFPFYWKPAPTLEQLSLPLAYIGHSSATAQWSKTMDTLTAWELLETAKAYVLSTMHQVAVTIFCSGYQFSKTPREDVKRFACKATLLCIKDYVDYPKSLDVWDTILRKWTLISWILPNSCALQHDPKQIAITEDAPIKFQFSNLARILFMVQRWNPQSFASSFCSE